MARTRRQLVAAIAVAGLVAGAAAVASGATAAPRAGSYAGTTSERSLVTFRIAPGHHSITGFHAFLGYNGRCGPGGGPGLTAAARPIAIGRYGRVRATVRLTFPQNPRAVPHPGRATISGHVTGGAARGSVVKVSNRKCYSESFRAARVGR
ncbi:MAG: hypothetical protein U0T02_14245 [Solirubrobacteraceae bacterium]